MKVLVDYVRERLPQAERPSGSLRRLYDLPTQRLAFNSFEISFRRPLRNEQGRIEPVAQSEQAEEDAIFRQVGDLLQQGLRWAGGPDANTASL